MLDKGHIRRDVAQAERPIDDRQIAWFDALSAQGLTRQSFNTNLLHHRRQPRARSKRASGGAIVGSLFTMSITLLLSLPARRGDGGLSRGVRAQEPLDRPRSRSTSTIWRRCRRSSIGLLGPRSLARLLRPAALGAAGRRHGAGADDPAHHHHRHPRGAEGGAALDPRGGARRRRVRHAGRCCITCVPLAMPGIMTGAIIGMARALGETAPLLMIGMVAFIVDVPRSIDRSGDRAAGADLSLGR